jgi:hypothetical protein
MNSPKRLIKAALIIAFVLCLVHALTAIKKTPTEPTASQEVTPTATVSLTPTSTTTPTAATEPPKRELGAGNTEDVRTDPDNYYYNADELAMGLLYDMVPLAPYFIDAQEKYGIDAVFLAAVAAEESGWGQYQFRRNNIFGFERCDFDSLPGCIDYAADWIKTQYLTPDGLYYNGESVTAINIRYNGRATWEENVKSIMAQIINRIESHQRKG